MIEKYKELKNNVFIKALSKILKFALTVVIVLLVLLIFIQKISNNKITFAGYSAFTVISGSMEPEYHIWDMLISKKVNTNDIKVGDDVVYLGSEATFKDKIVTHRVINIRNEAGKTFFTTKGIANDIEDPEIESTQVYGKVVYRSIILCFLSKVLNNTYGFYIIVFVPFVLILFSELLSFKKSQDRKKRRKEIEESQNRETSNNLNTMPNIVDNSTESNVNIEAEKNIEAAPSQNIIENKEITNQNNDINNSI